MNHKFMLDTNVLSDLMKDPEGAAATRLEAEGESSVCCSFVVAAERRYGAAKANSARLESRLEAVLSAIDVIPLDQPADRKYAAIRNKLAKRGNRIGANDLMIAAHAVANDLFLITDNICEFQRVDDLRVENWRES